MRNDEETLEDGYDANRKLTPTIGTGTEKGAKLGFVWEFISSGSGQKHETLKRKRPLKFTPAYPASQFSL
jgi:hypothetical protein